MKKLLVFTMVFVVLGAVFLVAQPKGIQKSKAPARCPVHQKPCDILGRCIFDSEECKPAKITEKQIHDRKEAAHKAEEKRDAAREKREKEQAEKEAAKKKCPPKTKLCGDRCISPIAKCEEDHGTVKPHQPGVKCMGAMHICNGKCIPLKQPCR
jgi:hypothetical protein